MNFQVIRHQQNHMATTFDFRISSASGGGLADRVLAACHAEVARLEQELSEFLPESPVYRLNHAAVGEKIVFSADGIELLRRACRLGERSGFAFNPLAKSTSSEAALARLQWNDETREVWSTRPGSWLSFGAIGKGYALDRARALIDAAGFENYLLSAGGSSIALSGYESPSRPWKLGWSWKKDATLPQGGDLGIPFAHWSGRRISLGISGTHEKGDHILGRKRAPLKSAMKSALIATASAADADALSTALFVSGWDEAQRYMAELPSPPAAAWIDETETPHWNGLFAQIWKVLGNTVLSAAALAMSAAAMGHSARADTAIDLSALGGAAKTFTPYDFERNPWWMLLPIFCFLIVIVHLRKTKPKRERRKLTEKVMKNAASKTPVSILLAASLLWVAADAAHAATIEPLGKAVMAILGTPKAFAKTLNGTQVYYSKNAQGRADKVAFIQHGTYQPDCTHTWAVGVDAATATVTEVRVVEMACPHAYPTRSASFLDQFKGKGPADVAHLDSEVHVVAKATGSSKLATTAVKRSITTMEAYKGQF